MAWILLFFAGIFEVIWAFFMKQSDGFTLLIPSIITLLGMVASVVLLAISMKSLPLGTAYTVWTGIGAIGAFIVGLLILGEPANTMRLIAAGLIVIGLLMMKLAS
ncbi:DMT family transporter [Legionella sp.]|uniref:DMT family transporter n=1 Tax=Legionella sp. TaxID=459 RepID=UPI003C9E7F3E